MTLTQYPRSHTLRPAPSHYLVHVASKAGGEQLVGTPPNPPMPSHQSRPSPLTAPVAASVAATFKPVPTQPRDPLNPAPIVHGDILPNNAQPS